MGPKSVQTITANMENFHDDMIDAVRYSMMTISDQKKRNNRLLLRLGFELIAIILIIDFLGFLLWGLSGQIPDGNFYIGTISVHVLQFIVR